jgi:GT2 family glycosyltransferase/glycosyltransferase involved in cell wall biosynthesis
LFYRALENQLGPVRKWPWSDKDHSLPVVGPPVWGVEDFLLLLDGASGKKRPVAKDTTVRASIIIPVYNNVGYTFQCLRSLLREVDLTKDEIVVIDNGSQDDTAQVLNHFRNVVKTIHNEENAGFVAACNQGAACARGKYFVFLNNDTVVQPGWLENLAETAELDPHVGGVGSMLVYPDGRLQEAGGLVWSDGTAANYGKGGEPGDFKYNFAREVDYCSGASLLVRGDLFNRLGGFDVRYAPAYYEDTDLCFSIRSKGFKVVYQPASRVVHFEGITAGTDVHSGIKRYQEINRAKFVSKWRDILQREHQESGTGSRQSRADRRNGPRILVFDQHLPTPDQDSGSVRMCMILNLLAKWARPVFVPLMNNQPEKYKERLQKMGVAVVENGYLKKIIREQPVDLAIVSRANVAKRQWRKLRKLTPGIKTIFDTVDLHFVRYEREFALNGDRSAAERAARYRSIELGIARKAHQIWCVTDTERDLLKQAVPRANVQVVPNIHAPKGRGGTFEEREGLVFIGGFKHAPNTDAVLYFVNDIFPRVLEALPNLRFYVVGSAAPSEVTRLESPHIAILSYVPDISPLFHGARLSVAPLRYGAGMKGKIGSALSYGVPVVTTTIGAEGMRLRHGYEALIADDPDEFARAIIEAYTKRDLWERLSNCGYQYVSDNFTPEIIGRQIRAQIEAL